MIKSYLALCLLLLPLLTIRAQDSIDSLRSVAGNSSLPASSRLQALYMLADHYRNSKPDSTRLLAGQQLIPARSARDTAAQGRGLQMPGYYLLTGNYRASCYAPRRGSGLSLATGYSSAAAQT